MKARVAPRLALVVAALALLGVERPPGLGDVVEVRHWSYPDYTRVVIQLSRPVDTTVHRLPPDPRTGRPERLYVDLPGIWVGRHFENPIHLGDGLLRGVRIGQNTLTTTRVVLDLQHYTRDRLLELRDPNRVVIDVYGDRDSDDTASPRGGRRHVALPAELRVPRTIVIDPGHGGKDPGAIGVGGIREKDVTLALGRLVRDRLRAEGFRVVMTRDSDRYLSLEERTAIAEAAHGDVFVSIHANAAPRRAARGIEIYTLDQKATSQTLRVAARESDVSPRDLDALQRTVARLRISEVSRRSALLARLINDDIASGIEARWPTVRDLGLKKGPFYVLYLSSMPSVLIEVGFLTHPREAARLRNPAYLSALADEIADGISRYRDRVAPVVAGSAQ